MGPVQAPGVLGELLELGEDCRTPLLHLPILRSGPFPRYYVAGAFRRTSCHTFHHRQRERVELGANRIRDRLLRLLVRRGCRRLWQSDHERLATLLHAERASQVLGGSAQTDRALSRDLIT